MWAIVVKDPNYHSTYIIINYMFNVHFDFMKDRD